MWNKKNQNFEYYNRMDRNSNVLEGEKVDSKLEEVLSFSDFSEINVGFIYKMWTDREDEEEMIFKVIFFLKMSGG